MKKVDLQISFTVPFETYPSSEPTPYLGNWRPGMKDHPIINKRYHERLIEFKRQLHEHAKIIQLKMNKGRPIAGRIKLMCTFFVGRPKAHFSESTGNIKERFLNAQITKWPNVTRQALAVHEGLTSILFDSIYSVDAVEVSREWSHSTSGRTQIAVQAFRIVSDDQPELEL